MCSPGFLLSKCAVTGVYDYYYNVCGSQSSSTAMKSKWSYMMH